MKCKLPEGWEEVKLIEITEKIGSGATPRGGAKVYIDVGVNLIRSQNVLDLEFSTDGLVCIDGDAAEKLNNVEVFKNDILINITGDSVARTCLVPDDILPARVNQHVSIIRTDEALAYHKYISYKLQDLKILLLSYSSSGATRKALTKSMLENLKISLPQISEQQAIADTLSSLDNKIELNNKINQNLEQQAQAIFKHWFVDFEFPDENGNPYKSSDGEMLESELGMIPKGWEVNKLKDFLPVVTGKKNANIATDDGEYKFFTCSQDSFLTDDYSFEGKAILVAGNGDFNVKFYNGRFEAYQRTYVLIPKEEELAGFIYYMVKYNLDKIILNARGSVISYLTKGDLENSKIAFPKTKGFGELIEILDIINIKILSNIKQNERLAQLRDTLLPKLMSGEIRIPLD